jgi:hypothetical protein
MNTQMQTLDDDLYYMVSQYGFKMLHSRLLHIMKEEYSYLHSQLVPTQNPVQESLVKELPPDVPVKKTRKPRAKKVQAEVPTIPGTLSLSEFEQQESQQTQQVPEIKEVVLVPPQGFRDPKEVKEYQKKAEEAKRRENDALGLQVHAILTKENLKKWIEEEGHTYAWVAREKAGCPDTQVAATAQMMGIKSKISRKRGKIMTGN